MAAVTLLGSVLNTTNGSKTVTATPAVGDLIVIIAAHTGNTSSAAPTDNNADGLGTYSLVNSAVKASSADTMRAWVRSAFIGSATSTVFSTAPGTTTGGGMAVLKVTGMSRKALAAVLQSAIQSNQAAGTPAPVFAAAAQTANAIVAALFNATNPATMTARSSPAYTERVDTGYATPTTGFEVMTINSGETGTTITWGNSSASAFASIALELDTRNTVQVSQSVPDAALSAVAGAVAQVTSTQEVGAMPATFIVQTQPSTLSPVHRYWQLARRGTSRRIAYSSAVSSDTSVSLSVNQDVQAVAQSATAAVVGSSATTQAVADASLSAVVSVTVVATATQSVQDAALNATTKAVAGAILSQSVPDVGQAATSSVRVASSVSQALPAVDQTVTASVVGSLTSAQSVPDAALVSTVSTLGGFQAAQSVPDAVLVASAVVRVAASVSASAGVITQASTAAVAVKLSLAQQIPDINLTALVDHTASLTQHPRWFLASRKRNLVTFTSNASTARTLQASQSVPDATLTASAAAVAALTLTHQVPAVGQVASIGPVSSVSVSQSVSPVDQTASAQTIFANTPTAHQIFYASRGKGVISWRGPEWTPPPPQIYYYQTLPDAVMVATVTTGLSLSAAQSVPDASLNALAKVVAGASSAQAVAAASQAASVIAVAKASSAQQVAATSQSAQAAVVATAQVSQSVPDATLTAVATGNTSVSNLFANQLVPPITQVAVVGPVNRVTSTQLVPDAAMVAAVNAAVSAAVNHAVPHPSQTASAQVLLSMQAIQVVPDAALDARVFTVMSQVNVAQDVPDITTLARVTTRQWGLPAGVKFTFTPTHQVTYEFDV